MEKIRNLNPETLKRYLDGVADKFNEVDLAIAPLKKKREAVEAKIEAKERAKAEARELLARFAAEEKVKKEAKAKADAVAKANAAAIAEAKKLIGVTPKKKTTKKKTSKKKTK